MRPRSAHSSYATYARAVAARLRPGQPGALRHSTAGSAGSGCSRPSAAAPAAVAVAAPRGAPPAVVLPVSGRIPAAHDRWVTCVSGPGHQGMC